jgi:hypothetical protein
LKASSLHSNPWRSVHLLHRQSRDGHFSVSHVFVNLFQAAAIGRTEEGCGQK